MAAETAMPVEQPSLDLPAEQLEAPAAEKPRRARTPRAPKAEGEEPRRANTRRPRKKAEDGPSEGSDPREAAE